MRVSDIFSEQVPVPQSRPAETQSAPAGKTVNPTDRVTMDVPLLLRIMEYSKEDAKTDMDLHHVVEKLVELSANGQPLNMDNYNDIVSGVQEDSTKGLAPAEKLIKDVEYRPEHSDDEEDVQEGYGRYWCSTDKRWKERKGPKQSRG